MHLLLRLSRWALVALLAWVSCSGRATVGGEGEAEAEGEAEPRVDAAIPDAAPPDAGRRDAGCACPEFASPVCGLDGVSYDNLCFARCAEAAVACLGNCPCPEACGECTGDEDCFPGQYCNAADVCLASCACPPCSVCAGHCIAATICELMECDEGYSCRCGGAGPGPHVCQCGRDCGDEMDCTDPRQEVCCDGACTDPCTCHCR